MIVRSLPLLALSLACFTLSSTVIGQTKISMQEQGYFDHPTLIHVEFDGNKEKIATISSVTWPFRIEEKKTVRMKLDGTEIVEKRMVANQKFHSATFKSILPAYSYRDLNNKRITQEEVETRLKAGAIGIQNAHWTGGITSADFGSVFKQDSFLMLWRPSNRLSDKQQAILKKHGTKGDYSTGYKSIGDEGYYDCPIIFKDIAIEKDKLTVKSIYWRAEVDEPKKVNTLVGEMLDFPFCVAVRSVHELERSYSLDRLEFRTPEGGLVDSSDAIQRLNNPEAVSIFLPQNKKLHPNWSKALKKSVIVISKAPRQNEEAKK